MTSASYRLQFSQKAIKEWRKLDNTVRRQFEAKLRERLSNPRVPSAALHGMPDCYKIKLRDIGYRLVYRVNDHMIVVTVISVGKRDGGDAYSEAMRRLRDLD
mgnify:CR=1 FL=1